jgi:hypothetical protein
VGSADVGRSTGQVGGVKDKQKMKIKKQEAYYMES